MKLEAKVGGVHWKGARLIATVNFFRVDPTPAAPGAKQHAVKFASEEFDVTDRSLEELRGIARDWIEPMSQSYATFEALNSHVNEGLCLASFDTDATPIAAPDGGGDPETVDPTVEPEGAEGEQEADAQ